MGEDIVNGRWIGDKEIALCGVSTKIGVHIVEVHESSRRPGVGTVNGIWTEMLIAVSPLHLRLLLDFLPPGGVLLKTGAWGWIGRSRRANAGTPETITHNCKPPLPHTRSRHIRWQYPLRSVATQLNPCCLRTNCADMGLSSPSLENADPAP
ncbi:hypothetical protein BU26DRAFT_237636 [Trematosphaeria pertusa]|uniref:Uncharacterized protein n=1 Tax=Trematosphaeria pertusa TaxID=390896 RepID=A0A6A6HQM0_9PLEO|nr:uncharacterized protein BU26DRAFT_237636 [Trematosphaeria pertusa]KAF2240435.1 hypothetical protein BU26DRAFT_237636 [Trematosphaeria pertusa]